MGQPRACVLFESTFGSTERVAKAVARGLRDEGYDATVVDVRLALFCSPENADLVVVGAPTHTFSALPRDLDALRGARSPGSTGVRDWLEFLPTASTGAPLHLAVFDTRAAKVCRFLSAGRAIRRLARRHGARMVGDLQGFLVEDVRGPLREGEVQRARAWGRSLAAEASLAA